MRLAPNQPAYVLMVCKGHQQQTVDVHNDYFGFGVVFYIRSSFIVVYEVLANMLIYAELFIIVKKK